MIFFGTRGKVVSGPTVDGVQCPSCDNRQFHTFGVIRYFHLYWIPMFPTSQKLGIECTHCKRTLMDNEVPADVQRQVRPMVFNKKTLWSSFIGLIIIACLCAAVAFAGMTADPADSTSAREARYIEQPMANDLYLVDMTKVFTDSDSAYKYGILRVRNLADGQVDVQVGKFAYNRKKGVNKAVRSGEAYQDDYYAEELVDFTLEELKALKDERAIFSIERK